MKARDQKRRGFYCWNRMGRRMQYRQSPRTSEKLVYNTTNKKWGNYWTARKLPCSPTQKWVHFHLPPTITFYECWTSAPRANLDFHCGSQRNQERTEVVRKVCNTARCLLGRGYGAAMASTAHARSCFSLDSCCLWSFTVSWVIFPCNASSREPSCTPHCSL